MPAFAAKLRPSPQQDPLSKYLYDSLSPKTQKPLSAAPVNQARLRRGLAEDLNRLLERELKIKQRLKAKQQEKDAVDQEIADGNTSDRLRRRRSSSSEPRSPSCPRPARSTNRSVSSRCSFRNT